MSKWFFSWLIGSALGLAAAPALAITTYTITQIGLTDAAHTGNYGYQYNYAQFLNATGQVAGFATLFNSSASPSSQSAWIFNGSTTQEIGLTDAAHTRYDGYRYNNAIALNNAGQVAGNANFYNGGLATGSSAWIFNGSITQEIGLTDAAHTGNNGYQYDYAQFLNNTGQVAGYANRYNGVTYTGQSAWIYNGSITQEIGLTDATHTRNDGYQFNYISFLNNAGQGAGGASRYNGATATGSSAWFFNGSATQEIGLTDAAHTGNNGYQVNNVSILNDAGQAVGYANRYTSGSGTGQSAWFYNGSNTQEIGLTDAAHTRNDGYQVNQVSFLNNAGDTIGNANRYNGATATGQSAWFYNGSNTQEIGLTDAAHTRNDGYQVNHAYILNNAGQVAGLANRYNGATATGQSTWVYNGSNTQEVGPTDAAHTRNDGYQYSYAQFLNNAGQVAGNAYRYNGATSTGQTAWLFDPLTGHTYSVDASISASTGHAYSETDFLGDNGLMLGIYTLYDATGASLGNQAFSFTVADGFNDLGSLVNGGLNASGWNYLASVIDANGVGQIIGNGVLDNMSGQAAYLLTPVPEAQTYAMFLVGLSLISGVVIRRRQEATCLHLT